MTGTTRRTGAIRTGGRSARVVKAVLSAAEHELRINGYDDFRVGRVAHAAGVNKTSIYRRWPTKLALVTAALHSRPIMTDAPPDLGSLRADLSAMVGAWGSYCAHIGWRDTATMLNTSDPGINAVLAMHANEYYDRHSTVVARAIGRGELAADTNPRRFLQTIAGLVHTTTVSAKKLLERSAIDELISSQLHGL